MRYVKEYPVTLKDGRIVEVRKNLTRDQARDLLARNYTEVVCSFDEMLNTPNTYRCMYSTLYVED